jgi:hypothetical protein
MDHDRAFVSGFDTLLGSSLPIQSNDTFQAHNVLTYTCERVFHRRSHASKANKTAVCWTAHANILYVVGVQTVGPCDTARMCVPNRLEEKPASL